MTIRAFHPADAEACAVLTFPAYRALLREPTAHRVALVADGVGGEPAGLALGVKREGAEAELLSLFVRPPHRHRGLGAKLLAGWEAAAASRGATAAHTAFSTGLPGADAFAALLAARGWSTPHLRMVIARLDRGILAAPWMRHTLPPGFACTPWCELAGAERAALAEDERAGALPGLPTPLFPPELRDPATSLTLRENGRIVGWLLTLEIDAKTLCYQHLYLRPEVRGRVHPLALAAEAVRRQETTRGIDSRGSFAVFVRNAAALNFFRRRVAPYACGWSETRGSGKALAAST